jgi:hypothetical protein
MNDILDAAWDRNTRIENFAAELTSAVFPVVLRYGRKDQWLKLQLGLWRALADTAMGWVRHKPPAGSGDDLETWREALLVSLTESAFYVALKYGVKGSLLELKLCLYRAVRLVTRRHGRVRQSE